MDDWYETYLESKYSKYMADVIYCNDREVTSGTTATYGAYTRLITNKSPKLTCTNQSDRYTVNDTVKGNGLLTKPIGLITADEIVMAGGVAASSNYLGNDYAYWTMSPASGASVFSGEWDGSYLSIIGVSATNNNNSSDMMQSARPVINLKADVLFEGNGAIDNPYKIVVE